jgi:VWFA-related protein
MSTAHLVLAAALAVQAPGQTQPPIIKETVKQVLVPVVVTDKAGHHVTGLKPEDFQLSEDGTPQDIVAFNTVTETVEEGRRAESGSIAPRVPANTHKSSAVDALPKRTYLICVDTLHSAFANFARVREALKAFFRQEQNGESQYALIALGRDVRVVQDSTRDPAKILAAIKSKNFLTTIHESEAASTATEIQQFTYMMRDDYCSKCACEAFGTTTDGPMCSGAKSRVQLFLTSFGERTSVLDQNFLSALRELAGAIATMPTTRTIVFISDGFNRFPGRELYSVMDGFGPKDRSFEFNPRDTHDGLQSVLKLAVRYDIRFYTLDSRGLYTMASLGGSTFDASTSQGAFIPNKVDLNRMTVAHENTDALAELARETGGLFFENNNDLLKGIERAFADGREYYVLAYISKNKAEDGTFRHIAVEVNNKKLHVNAKAGYWATKE